MTDLLHTLHAWADQGWLRRLDSALAAFVQEQDPQAAPAVLVASALLAQMEGRGHSCLPLAKLVQPAAACWAGRTWPSSNCKPCGPNCRPNSTAGSRRSRTAGWCARP